MSDKNDAEKARGAPEPDDPVLKDYARSRKEGAFLSPFGTEGCQWDGFPDYDEEPSGDTSEDES